MPGMALLIIDMLNDFFRQHAHLAEQRARLVAATNALAGAFREHGQPVFWVRQEFAPDLHDAFLEMRKHGLRLTIAGTDGCEILPELDRQPADVTIVKKRYSAFFGTELDDTLKRLRTAMLVVAGINTLILVTSSFTMHWALQSIKRNNRRGLQAGLVLTILLGAAFLLTQIIEYAHVGFNTSDGAFASVFFGLTGLHGAHVFVGLSLLTMAAVRAFRGHFSPEHHHGVELPGIYWHFVDVMWIVVYVTVYLL